MNLIYIIKKYNKILNLLKCKYYILVKRYRNKINNLVLTKNKNNIKNLMKINIKINHYKIKIIKLNEKFINLYNILNENLYNYNIKNYGHYKLN